MFSRYVNNLNITLFDDFLWIKEEELKNIWFYNSIKLIEEKIVILEQEFTTIFKLYKEVIEDSKIIQDWLKNNLINFKLDKKDLIKYLKEFKATKRIEILNLVIELKTLKDIKNKLKLIKFSFIFELEKYFLVNHSDEQLRLKNLIELHKINKKLAYWKLSSNQEYLIEALAYLQFYISNYFDRLNTEEQKLIMNFYKNTCKKYKVNIAFLKEKSKNFEGIKLENSYLSKKVSIKQLSENFEDFIKYLWVGFKVLEDPDFSNFSVSWSTVNIPTWKNFSHLKIWSDMLRLMKHEIWTHVFTRNNTLKILWKYTSMPYQNEREEGLAVYNESLLFEKVMKPLYQV